MSQGPRLIRATEDLPGEFRPWMNIVPIEVSVEKARTLRSDLLGSIIAADPHARSAVLQELRLKPLEPLPEAQ